jgi:MinD-like ATPase involved in chromosome partitioning or flagellar assembly
MVQILTIHSYRGGTGKSNLTANLAYLMARAGRRVAVLDTDLQSPGVHMVLGLPKARLAHTLSDYLFGKCDLEEAAYDMSRDLAIDGPGALFLLPSSMTVEAIVRIVSEGYDVGKLNDHFNRLGDDLGLDLLVLDTHPGLNRETMLTTAISDALVVVIRPDTQDFHGTAVLMEVAGRLGVPRIYMVANKVPQRLDPATVERQIANAFGRPVLGLLPLTEELVLLGSRGLFTIEHPDHPISAELARVSERLLEGLSRDRDP